MRYKTKEAAFAAAEIQRARITEWLGTHTQKERKVSVLVTDNDSYLSLSVCSDSASPCGTAILVARMMVDYIASHGEELSDWSMWANNGRVMGFSINFFFEKDEEA